MTNEDYARKICCSGCNNYVCYTNKKRCPTLEDLLTMAAWKEEQLADYLQQSWQRYKAAPTPTASAKRHLIEQMANDLGVRLKFNNPYID